MKGIHHFVLEPDHTIREVDSDEWAVFLENGDRQVARDKVGRVEVSTVFIGLLLHIGEYEHNELFETKVFGGEHDGLTRRYKTWDAAVRGHEEVVKELRKAIV
jgi:hypothetical protein